MSSTTATSALNVDDAATAPDRRALVAGVIVAVLFIALFHNFLWRMTLIATSRWGGDWSHAVIIPFISFWLAWQHRHRLAATPRKPSPWGLPLLFLGIFSYAWWIYPGRNDMFQGYSMILALFGLLWFVAGRAWLRRLWVPVLYLGFAVKVSDRIWEQIAWQLQLVAARCSVYAIRFVGAFPGVDLDATVKGSTIDLSFPRQGQWVTEALNVAEACSGLRMLAAFVALGVAVAFLSPRRWWQRLIMVLLTLPIAVAVNVGRVTALAVLHRINPELSAGDVHTFVGMVMLVPALLLFLLIGWILEKVIVYEAEPGSVAEPEASATGRASRGRPVVGILVGAVVCLLVGLTYLAVLASVRPDMLGLASAAWWLRAIPLLTGLGLLAGLWWIHRHLRGPDGPGTVLAISVGVLLVAATGLQAAVAQTRAVLIKQPVPLRVPLLLVPARMGSWEMTDERRLSREVLEELRTENYLWRTYRNTELEDGVPGSQVHLHVAYYTGTPDTVPHVPERCYVAGGLVPVYKGTTELKLTGPQYRPAEKGVLASSHLGPVAKEVRLPSDQLTATLFTFASPSRPQAASNVLYFFAANGKFLSTPDLVRLQGFDLSDRYSYYCKIEVGVPMVPDAAAATRVAEGFLSRAVPEIMACLPDWVDVREGRWPPQNRPAP